MWGVGQGQIVYNKHFETYFYVHLDLGKFRQSRL
jgi:bacteriorhodopsin